MFAFIAITLPVGLFCVGLIAGMLLGFKRGYSFHKNDRFWECGCDTEQKCLFFGPKEIAIHAIQDCSESQEVKIVEIEWHFPDHIDLTLDKQPTKV